MASGKYQSLNLLYPQAGRIHVIVIGCREGATAQPVFPIASLKYVADSDLFRFPCSHAIPQSLRHPVLLFVLHPTIIPPRLEVLILQSHKHLCYGLCIYLRGVRRCRFRREPCASRIESSELQQRLHRRLSVPHSRAGCSRTHPSGRGSGYTHRHTLACNHQHSQCGGPALPQRGSWAREHGEGRGGVVAENWVGTVQGRGCAGDEGEASDTPTQSHHAHDCM
ncbi:hypothetical protein LXA43DRAFT_489205 [Ganoderma leucocontextum]|nr:hypothetical protein LXA43DRAFT_489205 [Ganoderma leucocontextum]